VHTFHGVLKVLVEMCSDPSCRCVCLVMFRKYDAFATFILGFGAKIEVTVISAFHFLLSVMQLIVVIFVLG
jgi:hypothetical protein